MTSRSFNRRDFLKRMAAASLSIRGGLSIGVPLALQSCASRDRGPYNVVWIVMDTARADRCTFQGYTRDTTPNLDLLAKESTVYANAITAAPWTFPSHASMFTGAYPSLHNATNAHQRLDTTLPTIAEVLTSSGYDTANFTCNGNVTRRSGVSRGFASELYTKFDPKGDKYDKGAREQLGHMRNWLDSRTSPVQPFFLFANFIEPHSPNVHLHRDHLKRYLESSEDVEAVVEEVKKRKLEDVFRYVASGRETMTERDFRVATDLYDANIRYLDSQLGEFVSYLRTNGLLDNTLLIITSDHGENLGEHGLRNHQFCVYDTLLRVPLIVRYPEGTLRGKVIDKQVQTVDIFPTIADVLELDWAGKELVQGESVLSSGARQYAISEYWPSKKHMAKIREFGGSTEGLSRVLKSYRTDKYKFIWTDDGTHELYDLVKDPQENENVIEDLPAVAHEYETKLSEWLDATPSVSRSDTKEPMVEELSDEEKASLEALGYVQ